MAAARQRRPPQRRRGQSRRRRRRCAGHLETAALTAGLPEDIIEKVQATARGARYQYHYQAAAWFGRAIAALVGVDPDEKTGRARLRRLTDLWITDGVLVLVEKKTGQRKLTNFVGAPGDTGDPGASGVVIDFPNTYQPGREEGGDE